MTPIRSKKRPNSPVLLLVVGEVRTVDRMRYAGLSLQRLFPLRDLVLEFGPLLLLVVFLAVGRRIASAAAATTATAGVAGTFFGGTAPASLPLSSLADSSPSLSLPLSSP